MQISKATANELMVLLNGLRSSHVADQGELISRLKIQLETELSGRYSLMLGSTDEQERTIVARNAAPVKRGRPAKR